MLKFNRGDDCNFSGKPAKGEFTLHGDPETKPEKAYTILNFPGGSIELSRTSDNEYWAHITVHKGKWGEQCGTVTDARIDAKNRYVAKSVQDELAQADFEHIAIRIKPA